MTWWMEQCTSRNLAVFMVPETMITYKLPHMCEVLMWMRTQDSTREEFKYLSACNSLYKVSTGCEIQHYQVNDNIVAAYTCKVKHTVVLQSLLRYSHRKTIMIQFCYIEHDTIPPSQLLHWPVMPREEKLGQEIWVKCTKSCLPLFPKSMSGLTTSLVLFIQGFFSRSSWKLVFCLTWAAFNGRSTPTILLYWAFNSLLESYSLIFFLAILTQRCVQG